MVPEQWREPLLAAKLLERRSGSLSTQVKRAYRRARARAARAGGTYYRGRWRTADQLQALHRRPGGATKDGPASGTASAGPTHGDPRRRRTSSHRLRCITWNISGASSEAWQELMRWLQVRQQDFDIIIVQETHWRHEGCRTFSSGPWHVVAAGTTAKDKCAGVAVPTGRLLHVRLQHRLQCTDVLAVYQHVWRTGLDQATNLALRGQIWEGLRGALRRCPLRNELILAGDFNCGLRGPSLHVGTAVIPSGTPAPDEDELLGLLQDFGLTVLNTWARTPRHTCVTAGSHTQIVFSCAACSTPTPRPSAAHP